MKNCQKLMRTLLLICALFAFPIRSLAEEDTTASEQGQETVGYSIRSVLPENQLPNSESYFYLKVAPDQQQTLAVEITNEADQSRKFKVEVNAASTNRNGLVVYDNPSIEPDKTLVHPMNELAKPQEDEVEVPAHETKRALIDITVPSEPFEGVLLGGIHVSLVDESSDEKDKKAMGISNKYTYVLGLVLTEHEDSPLFGQTDLELAGVKPELNYGSKVLEAQLRNPHPEVFNELEVNGSIRKKGSPKKIAEKKQKEIKIAPNSVFPYQLDWGIQNVEAGTYVFEAKAKAGEKEWLFEEEFTITRQQARQMNKEAVIKQVIPDWWFYSVVAVGILTIVFMGLRVARWKQSKGGAQ